MRIQPSDLFLQKNVLSVEKWKEKTDQANLTQQLVCFFIDIDFKIILCFSIRTQQCHKNNVDFNDQFSFLDQNQYYIDRRCISSTVIWQFKQFIRKYAESEHQIVFGSDPSAIGLHYFLSAFSSSSFIIIILFDIQFRQSYFFLSRYEKQFNHIK